MVRQRKANPLVFIVAALVVIATGWWQQRGGEAKPVPASVESVGTPRAASPASPATRAPAEARERGNRIDPVPSAERPRLLETLALIDRGGPFPHRLDGSVFQNREGRLPQRPRGYYREYTVPTPGASNRGARRLVVGNDGDIWYTSDHYNTFVRIDE
jgi:ribonuclease T1